MALAWTAVGPSWWRCALPTARLEVALQGDRYRLSIIDTQKPWDGMEMFGSWHTSERAAKRAARYEARRIGLIEVRRG